MHFQFSTAQILWTLTFASLLVLLVVLLGRDRAKRYPLFTFYVVVVALRLLASRLLYGRLAAMPLTIALYSLAILAALAGVLVAIEMARRAFAGAGSRAWLIGTLAVLAVAGVTMWLWGPWPTWQTLTAGGSLVALRFMELAGQRGDMLSSLLAVEVGILVAVFGRRFHAGAHSHTRQLVLGLSITGIAELGVRGIWRAYTLKTQVTSQADYKRLVDFQTYLFNANNIIFICAVIWWIVCLWMDEPGAVATPASGELEDNSAVKTGGAEGN